MAAILDKLWSGYQFLFEELPDPRTKPWVLVAKPYQVTLVLAIYLTFIQKWGPQLMRKLPAFNLDRILIVYNFLQVLACLYIFVSGIKLGWGWNYKWLCEPVDYSTTPHAINYVSMIYCYFLIKILDLMDTVFFVLRKKHKQISFLHIYHHAGMVLLTWGVVTYMPGGHGTLIGVINCFVHVVMYSYYLYTVAIPSAKNSMWWKKYITQLQIIQFFWAVIHMSAIIFKPDCEYPRWTSALILPHNLFILVLFIDFYIKTYIRIPNEQNVKELKNRQPNGIGCKNGSEHKNDQINEHITGKYKESEGTKLRLKENAYFVSSIDHKMK